MTDPLFRTELGTPLPELGAVVELTGPEGRHASVVRRITPGEPIVLADGRGRAVTGPVLSVTKTGLTMQVQRQLSEPAAAVRIIAVQALAKGDRSELAVETMTEVGVDEIVPWQASRSIVRWSGERGEKSAEKWRSAVREAAKQSRRLWVPEVCGVVSTRRLVAMITEQCSDGGRAYVLHEDAEHWLDVGSLPTRGSVLLIIGPEGGCQHRRADRLRRRRGRAGADQRRGAAHLDRRRRGGGAAPIGRAGPAVTGFGFAVGERLENSTGPGSGTGPG